MKKYLLPLFVIILVALNATSCLDVGDDIDRVNLRGAAATLARTPSGETVFVTDDSITMHPSEAVTAADSLIGMRYFLDFRLLEQTATDFDIAIINIQQMIVDTVVASAPSRADDYVEPRIVWTSGSYINMLLTVEASTIWSHDFTLYDVSTDDNLCFELRHDRNNDPYNTQTRAAISFDAKKYIDAATADSIPVQLSINVKNYGHRVSTFYLTK